MSRLGRALLRLAGIREVPTPELRGPAGMIRPVPVILRYWLHPDGTVYRAVGNGPTVVREANPLIIEAVLAQHSAQVRELRQRIRFRPAGPGQERYHGKESTP